MRRAVDGSAGDPNARQMFVYDDTGRLYHQFEGPNTRVGHHDFSPDGRFAYFNYLEMWQEYQPLEIRVVNVDGSDDRVVYRIPWAEMRYVQNLHLSWPSQVREWFVASFFPAADNLPPAYAPPLDEILLISTDGTHRFLARTETAYARANARTGGSQGTFWAQPVASVSSDGTRICFNSNRAGTIDQYLLYTS